MYKDVDHEHEKPGTHRGILCAWCNTALGRLEPNMQKVLEYLAEYGKYYEPPLKDLNARFEHNYARNDDGLGETP